MPPRLTPRLSYQDLVKNSGPVYSASADFDSVVGLALGVGTGWAWAEMWARSAAGGFI